MKFKSDKNTLLSGIQTVQILLLLKTLYLY